MEQRTIPVQGKKYRIEYNDSYRTGTLQYMVLNCTTLDIELYMADHNGTFVVSKDDTINPIKCITEV